MQFTILFKLGFDINVNIFEERQAYFEKLINIGLNTIS